jgi:hypothetical protein
MGKLYRRKSYKNKLKGDVILQEELKIEKLNITDIKPYSKNAKRHPKKQIEQIKKSIQDFGFNDPIAIDENNVIIERTRSL